MLFIAVTTGACEIVEPDGFSLSPTIVLSLDSIYEPSLDPVQNVLFTVTRPDGATRDTALDLRPSAGLSSSRLTLRPNETASGTVINATLRLYTLHLFSGAGGVGESEASGPTVIPLEPVAEFSSLGVWVTSVGRSIPLGQLGDIVFLTDDPVPGAVISWTSSNPAAVRIVDGRAEALLEGSATLFGEWRDLRGQVSVSIR